MSCWRWCRERSGRRRRAGVGAVKEADVGVVLGGGAVKATAVAAKSAMTSFEANMLDGVALGTRGRGCRSC